MMLQCVRWQPSTGTQKQHTCSMFLCSSEPKKYLLQAPVLLRLAFHDAATHEVAAGDGGANASVQYEFSRPENTGLKRGWCGLDDDMGSDSCSACSIAAPVRRSWILIMRLMESFCAAKGSMCLLLLLVMQGCKSLVWVAHCCELQLFLHMQASHRERDAKLERHSSRGTCVLCRPDCIGWGLCSPDYWWTQYRYVNR